MKKIGFLSFGHWTPSPSSQTRSASDALLQSIELAVAAEELGADGAYFRVHHYARQIASLFPSGSERLTNRAGSTDRCNTFCELLSWGLIEQGLSRSFIEPP